MVIALYQAVSWKQKICLQNNQHQKNWVIPTGYKTVSYIALWIKDNLPITINTLSSFKCVHINNLRYANDTSLMAESQEKLKILLMKLKEESEEVDLKLNIQKMKIMASGPIIPWKIDRRKHSKQWQTLFAWASKWLQMVTAATKLRDVCSLEEKLWPT